MKLAGVGEERGAAEVGLVAVEEVSHFTVTALAAGGEGGAVGQRSVGVDVERALLDDDA